jgi:hypothetical protein
MSGEQCIELSSHTIQQGSWFRKGSGQTKYQSYGLGIYISYMY